MYRECRDSYQGQVAYEYAMLICVSLCVYRERRDGYQGQVAYEYAVLTKALWSGQYRSVAPRDFRVGKHTAQCLPLPTDTGSGPPSPK